MDHFTSSEPPHADIQQAVAADLFALANQQPDSPPSIAEIMNSSVLSAGAARDLVACVGSVGALESLELEPHPAEAIQLDGLDADDAELACQLFGLIVEADLILDAETITIIQRLLVRLAAHPDKPLQRKARIEQVAAAVVWVALSASSMVGRHRRALPASYIWGEFETTPASKVGRALVVALSSSDDKPSTSAGTSEPPMLTDPALLHSRYRRSLVSRRQELEQYIRERHHDGMSSHPIQVRPGQGVRFATRPTTIRWAVRSSDENGRATVMVSTGDLRSMNLMSISVPDAHRLIAALEHALNEPLAAAS